MDGGAAGGLDLGGAALGWRGVVEDAARVGVIDSAALAESLAEDVIEGGSAEDDGAVVGADRGGWLAGLEAGAGVEDALLEGGGAVAEFRARVECGHVAAARDSGDEIIVAREAIGRDDVPGGVHGKLLILRCKKVMLRGG